MKNRYKVSGYVTTVSYDGYEFELFLQKEENENWTDYDFILKSKGKAAVSLEDKLNIGDEIYIILPFWADEEE